jgi:hypothetical protein
MRGRVNARTVGGRRRCGCGAATVGGLSETRHARLIGSAQTIACRAYGVSRRRIVGGEPRLRREALARSVRRSNYTRSPARHGERRGAGSSPVANFPCTSRGSAGDPRPAQKRRVTTIPAASLLSLHGRAVGSVYRIGTHGRLAEMSLAICRRVLRPPRWGATPPVLLWRSGPLRLPQVRIDQSFYGTIIIVRSSPARRRRHTARVLLHIRIRAVEEHAVACRADG